MNKNLVAFMLCIACLALNTSLNAQIQMPKFGKGLQFAGADSTYQLKIGFRFQSLIVSDWSLEDEAEGYEGDFDANAMIRRSRLKFDGWAVTPRLKYKLELSLSNRDNGGGGDLDEFGNAANIILDALVTYKFYQNFSIAFGQSKLHGNRERVVSSGNLQFVDRSRLNSRYTLDRDMFLRLGNEHTFGENFLVRESLSVSQGEGKNQLTGINDGMNYTVRVEFLPFGKFQSKGDYVGSDTKREERPKLALGFTYDTNQNAARERGQKGSFITDENGTYVGKDLNSFFADLMFKYQGFSIMAEYADREADGGPLVFGVEDDVIGTYYTGSGFNFASGYLFNNDVELALRYTNINPDDVVASDETHYTIGLNKFFVGHKLKLQTDFSLIDRDTRQNTALWRLQMDIHF